MSAWELPESATINGRVFQVRSDYRVALDIFSVLQDPETSDRDRAEAALAALFPGLCDMRQEDVEPAKDFLLWFLAGGGEMRQRKEPKLADWEQDFPLMVAPINRALGYEIRACDHLHWWSFLSAYREVGDCLFAQVVAIRSKRAHGKKLTKDEQRFYRENHDLVDLRTRESAAESELFDEWIG